MRTLISILICSVLAICVRPDVNVVIGQPATSAAFSVTATTFTGAGTEWMERDADWTGATDGDTFTISFWWKPAAASATYYIYEGAQSRITIWENTSNDKIRMEFKDAAGVMLVQLDQNASVGALSAGTWYHVIASVDKSVDNRAHLYINNTECLTITTFVSDGEAGGDIDRTETDHAVGSYVGGSFYANGCLAELWISYSYMDLSDAGNRAKFYNAGAPVNLGTTGQTPTGVTPIVYLKGSGVGFIVNSGSGGDMFKKGATPFTTCGTIP